PHRARTGTHTGAKGPQKRPTPAPVSAPPPAPDSKPIPPPLVAPSRLCLPTPTGPDNEASSVGPTEYTPTVPRDARVSCPSSRGAGLRQPCPNRRSVAKHAAAETAKRRHDGSTARIPPSTVFETPIEGSRCLHDRAPWCHASGTGEAPGTEDVLLIPLTPFVTVPV